MLERGWCVQTERILGRAQVGGRETGEYPKVGESCVIGDWRLVLGARCLEIGV